ncbi:MAG TPA: tetratricopeptide repeat protein [Gemmatimonadaceae bacterium]|jgi:tetratricopeptide (TPR) repeat protein|nr:tetratricopeptide repeat protein [Gemmatimonadaceae bacterium]
MSTSTLPSDTLADHRDAADRLDAELGHPDAATRRDEIKAEIIARYKAVDRDLQELVFLKERLRAMAQRWKTLSPASETTPPPINRPAPEASTPNATEDALSSPDRPTPAPSKAMSAIETSQRMDRLNASTYIEKSWSLIAIGDHAGAEVTITRALEFATDSVEARSLLGWAQMLQEKYDDALGNFHQVLMAEPANALARVNVGYICLKKGIFGEAIEHLSKALRLDNDRKATLYANFYLGMLYFQREMYEDAAQFYRKAIALGPNLIEAHYELGRTCWRAGDRVKAIAAWRDGASANKFSPWGKRCSEMALLVEAGGEPSLDS